LIVNFSYGFTTDALVSTSLSKPGYTYVKHRYMETSIFLKFLLLIN